MLRLYLPPPPRVSLGKERWERCTEGVKFLIKNEAKRPGLGTNPQPQDLEFSTIDR